MKTSWEWQWVTTAVVWIHFTPHTLHTTKLSSNNESTKWQMLCCTNLATANYKRSQAIEEKGLFRGSLAGGLFPTLLPVWAVTSPIASLRLVPDVRPPVRLNSAYGIHGPVYLDQGRLGVSGSWLWLLLWNESACAEIWGNKGYESTCRPGRRESLSDFQDIPSRGLLKRRRISAEQ